ncbi:MAG: hypothetical protein BGO98_04355 [Myxococcales bacterium 68-20]|nr:hypothetical protein [Myxococcales bacterium]OJY20529.1 MAG: hypothetical protein BGO98_04355 [Myxococcales bacterium 68-20]
MIRKTLGLTTISALVLAASCSDSRIGDYIAPATVPGFEIPDSGADVVVEAELTSYCPSNKCPDGFTTCPTSRFPCDVDLKTDRQNCGACGHACPSRGGRENYECVDGACVLQCSASPQTFDCDGLADNGCETDPGSNDHCGACGDKCPDPAKPCASTTNEGDYQCGCPPGRQYCPGNFPSCLDPTNDDRNCGACNNFCDRNGGDGGPPPSNAYYGCVSNRCGQLKCNPNYGNCDGNASNGCETLLVTTQNCGACGKTCADGQECAINPKGQPECMCPAGKIYCAQSCFGGVCYGGCYDLSSDKDHCGACGFSCSSMFQPDSVGVCTYGTCTRRCNKGRADCNRNPADDCEVDTDHDPRNCGGCGNVCDAVAGQACVGGKCVVAPCDADRDAGKEAR